MKVRTRSERIRPVVDCSGDEPIVDSSAKVESDINTIVARAKRTGDLGDSARAAAARYGDFSQVPSFAEMQEKILAANELFAALPATVRRQFNNDPSEFVQAAGTREGVELLTKLGLGKEVEPTPSPAAPVPAAGQAAPPKGKSALGARGDSRPAPKDDKPAGLESDDE